MISVSIANTEHCGLYIHIPFCLKKCAYCDFYSEPGIITLIRPYIEAILKEAQKYRGMRFETLYIGGGTPSLLGAAGLEQLMKRLETVFDLSAISESTVEVNPDSGTPEFLEAAKSNGVKRVSCGVQSLSDIELKAVGRLHDAAQAINAIKTALKTGFKSVSADIIAGLPGQDWASLHDTLQKLVAVCISHLSLYCLSLEEGTPLAEHPPANLPSEDDQVDLFDQATGFLLEKGFSHYEISNFARPGEECQHNLNYWRGGEYLGLGPSAASHLNGRRFRNRADVFGYLANPMDQIEELETLDASVKAGEEAMLRLRLLNEGLDINKMAEKFGAEDIEPLGRRLEKLADESRLIKDGTRYRLPPDYVMTCNTILARVIGD